MLTSYARSLTGWAMRARSSRGHISSRSERLKHDGSRSEGRRNEWNDRRIGISGQSGSEVIECSKNGR